MLSTFIKLPVVIKIFVCLFLSGHCKPVLLYCYGSVAQNFYDANFDGANFFAFCLSFKIVVTFLYCFHHLWNHAALELVQTK